MKSLPLLLKHKIPFSLLGKGAFKSRPYVFDFSSRNDAFVKTLNTNDFESFQAVVFQKLFDEGAEWGIGSYLEERKILLRNYPQMIKEGRYYHLGLDIVVPGGTPLYAPLEGEVLLASIEDGFGNYGGFVVLKHEVLNTTFYSLYGHLNDSHIVQKGHIVQAGEQFAEVGSTARHTGGWFTHTHLQILTEQAIREGRLMQGYISKDILPRINELFPHPGLLFRYSTKNCL